MLNKMTKTEATSPNVLGDVVASFDTVGKSAYLQYRLPIYELGLDPKHLLS